MKPSQIGDISEAKVISRAMELGHGVSIPFGDSRYDMILDLGGTLNRVQVKTGRLRKGAILFNTRSINGRVGTISPRPYTKEEIDAFAVYCPDLDQCYLLQISNIDCEHSCSLRVNDTLNKQNKNIRWAKDYEF